MKCFLLVHPIRNYFYIDSKAKKFYFFLNCQMVFVSA